MIRRTFLQSGIGAAGAAVSTTLPTAWANEREPKKDGFRLKYAPHFGMFRHHAGEDLVDQLTFAADQGFTAWEDNGMKGRSVEEQERVGEAMKELKIEMGVFVATASFSDVTFARRRDDVWQKVLDDIRASVDVAKRVNARWMTVVPGLYDRGIE